MTIPFLQDTVNRAARMQYGIDPSTGMPYPSQSDVPPMSGAPSLPPVGSPAHRGILAAAGHFLSQKALPAIFGGGQFQQQPGDPNPLGAALMAAGNEIAQSAGGARRWGEFGPTPIASITAGLAAGHQVYQQAREQGRQRAEWNNLTGIIGDPNSTPVQRRMAIFRALPSAPGQQADVLNEMLKLDAPRPMQVFAPNSSYMGPDGQLHQVGGATREPGTDVVNAGGRQILIDKATGRRIADLGAAPSPPVTYMPMVGPDGQVVYGAGTRAGTITPTNAALPPKAGAGVAPSSISAASLGDATSQLRQLEDANPGDNLSSEAGRIQENASAPSSSTLGAVVNPVVAGVAQRLQSSPQANYTVAGNMYVDAALSALPHARWSPQARTLLRNAFLPAPGADEATATRARHNREVFTAAVNDARKSGRPVDATTVNQFAPGAIEAGESGSTGNGGPPTASGNVPRIAPRFLRGTP